MKNITNYGEVGQEKLEANMWKVRQDVKDLACGALVQILVLKMRFYEKFITPGEEEDRKEVDGVEGGSQTQEIGLRNCRRAVVLLFFNPNLSTCKPVLVFSPANI